MADATHYVYAADWTFSHNANVHIAKDEKYFTSWTPFESWLTDDHGLLKWPIPVIGVGDVEIPTDRPPNCVFQSPAFLRLTNVLYAPTAICNILGAPLRLDHYISMYPEFEQDSKGEILNRYQVPIAHFDKTRGFYAIKVHGPPADERFRYPASEFMLSLQWPLSERVKWEQRRATSALNNN